MLFCNTHPWRERTDGMHQQLSFLRQINCVFFLLTLLLPKEDTYSIFLLGMSHIPHTHPTHVFHLASVSSHPTLPFLFNSFLPPCPAKDLSLSPMDWWFASHLLLPLLEPTLTTWLVHLGAMGGFFFFLFQERDKRAVYSLNFKAMGESLMELS